MLDKIITLFILAAARWDLSEFESVSVFFFSRWRW